MSPHDNTYSCPACEWGPFMLDIDGNLPQHTTPIGQDCPGAGKPPAGTERQQCTYHIHGPQVGRNVVAWRKRCKRMVRVPPGSVRVRCWQHASTRER